MLKHPTDLPKLPGKNRIPPTSKSPTRSALPKNVAPIAGHKGGCRKGCSCRGCACGCLFFSLIFIAFAVYVLLARPVWLITPLKQWLNVDLGTVDYVELNPTAVYRDLDAQVEGFRIGENELVITQTQLKTLFDDRFDGVNSSEVYIDIRHNLLKMYWDAEASSGEPLWIVLDFKVDDKGKLYLDKLGTERIGLPPILNQALTQALLSAWRLGKQQSGIDIVELIIPLPQNVTVTKVGIDEDELSLTLNVQTGLESLFD